MCIFEELKYEKLNSKLISLSKDNEIDKKKYDSLFDFVNSESVNKLLSEASVSYQELEVNIILYIVTELYTWCEFWIFD